MSEPPDWMGAATDLLKQHALDAAADLLEEAPATAGLLERAVATMERFVRDAPMQARVFIDPMLTLIAEHRGESPEATLERLRPPPDAGAAVGALYQSGYFTESQLREI